MNVDNIRSEEEEAGADAPAEDASKGEGEAATEGEDASKGEGEAAAE